MQETLRLAPLPVPVAAAAAVVVVGRNGSTPVPGPPVPGLAAMAALAAARLRLTEVVRLVEGTVAPVAQGSLGHRAIPELLAPQETHLPA
jgi:hypothetical protein